MVWEQGANVIAMVTAEEVSGMEWPSCPLFPGEVGPEDGLCVPDLAAPPSFLQRRISASPFLLDKHLLPLLAST